MVGGAPNTLYRACRQQRDGIRSLWQPSKPNSDHKAYLNAYTTALKRKPFRLIYIDAFAGTGRIELQQDGETTRSARAGRWTAGPGIQMPAVAARTPDAVPYRAAAPRSSARAPARMPSMP